MKAAQSLFSEDCAPRENPPLLQIVYVSAATNELNEDTLVRLLADSRKRNAEKGITGLLLYVEGSIIHVIEGEESVVADLFTRIERDPRHRQVSVLSRKHIEQRDFPEYRMGFRREKLDTVAGQLPGFLDIVETRAVSDFARQGLSKSVSAFLRTFARVTGLEP